MPSNFHKKDDIVNKTYYRPPRFVKADFSGIKAREIIIQEGDRLDIIAQKIYGDPNFWRAIALFNDIGYFFDLTPGKVLRLPYDINKVLGRI